MKKYQVFKITKSTTLGPSQQRGQREVTSGQGVSQKHGHERYALGIHHLFGILRLIFFCFCIGRTVTATKVNM
jgi:hypothetical protein